MRWADCDACGREDVVEPMWTHSGEGEFCATCRTGEWEREDGVTCVVCPDCAFTFDAGHTNTSDGRPTHTCPLCEIQAKEMEE